MGLLHLELWFDDTSPDGISTADGTWFQLLNNGESGTWNANQTSAIPIPGVFILFGSGLISMIMLGRKSINTKE